MHENCSKFYNNYRHLKNTFMANKWCSIWKNKAISMDISTSLPIGSSVRFLFKASKDFPPKSPFPYGWMNRRRILPHPCHFVTPPPPSPLHYIMSTPCGLIGTRTVLITAIITTNFWYRERKIAQIQSYKLIKENKRVFQFFLYWHSFKLF